MQTISDYLNKKGKSLGKWLLLVVFILLPVLFLFSDEGARLLPGPLTRLYSSMEMLFGVGIAKLLFCGTWFAIGIVFYWHYVLADKNKDDDTFSE